MGVQIGGCVKNIENLKIGGCKYAGGLVLKSPQELSSHCRRRELYEKFKDKTYIQMRS